jgi:glucose dehydrogenase
MNKNELYRVSEELSLEDLIKEFMTGKKIGVQVCYENYSGNNYYYDQDIQLDILTGEINWQYQNCHNDNCGCNSHPRWVDKEIDFKKAHELLTEFCNQRQKLIDKRKENLKGLTN